MALQIRDMFKCECGKEIFFDERTKIKLHFKYCKVVPDDIRDDVLKLAMKKCNNKTTHLIRYKNSKIEDSMMNNTVDNLISDAVQRVHPLETFINTFETTKEDRIENV